MKITNIYPLASATACQMAGMILNVCTHAATYIADINCGPHDFIKKLIVRFDNVGLGLNRFSKSRIGGRQMDSNFIIKTLDLAPLPGEGGYYRETYRSSDVIDASSPGNAQCSTRAMSTAIYFMVTPESFSSLHRLKHDEVYHFYAGSPTELMLIYENGMSEIKILGNDISRGEKPQMLVPKGTWQGVRLKSGRSDWSLMGTTVAPGFDFEDFELGRRDELMTLYPDIKDLIMKYTRA